jgi:hypothetical protein
MVDIQSRIVLRQEGVARVPEDRFDEIQIANESAGNKEANFHPFRRSDSGHFGHHERPY